MFQKNWNLIEFLVFDQHCFGVDQIFNLQQRSHPICAASVWHQLFDRRIRGFSGTELDRFGRVQRQKCCCGNFRNDRKSQKRFYGKNLEARVPHSVQSDLLRHKFQLFSRKFETRSSGKKGFG
jgi:hypothetical protein